MISTFVEFWGQGGRKGIYNGIDTSDVVQRDCVWGCHFRFPLDYSV